MAADDIDGLETLADGRIVVKVRVRAIADGGEANRAVTELMAKALGVPKARVRILSGDTSRLKQIAVDGDPAKTRGDALRKLTAAKLPITTTKDRNDGPDHRWKNHRRRARARVADEVARVKRENGLTPGLAVVLVGSDPASQVYVRSKGSRPRRRAWR